MIVLILAIIGTSAMYFWMKSKEPSIRDVEGVLVETMAESEERGELLDHSLLAKSEQTIMDYADIKVLGMLDDSKVLLKISAVDIPSIFEKVYQTLDNKPSDISISDYLNLGIIKAIESNDCNYVTREIELSYSSTINGMELDYNMEFLDAIYGGLFSFLAKEVEK